MNNYTIYTHISSIMRGFACFERFLQISTLQAPSMLLEDVFEANGSTKFAREAQKCQHGQNAPNTAGETVQHEAGKNKKTREKIIIKEKVAGQHGGWHGP